MIFQGISVAKERQLFVECVLDPEESQEAGLPAFSEYVPHP